MKVMPGGYTGNYVFEFCDGAVIYRKLHGSDEETAQSHIFMENTGIARKAILRELLGIDNVEASVQDIANGRPRLPVLPGKPLSKSKIDSLKLKLTCVPLQYRAYYPGYQGEETAARSQDSDVEDESTPGPSQSRKRKAASRPVGRPKKAGVSDSQSGSQSIISFVLSRQASPAPRTGPGGGPARVMLRPNHVDSDDDETQVVRVNQPGDAAVQRNIFQDFNANN